jgi:hypothetical protein
MASWFPPACGGGRVVGLSEAAGPGSPRGMEHPEQRPTEGDGGDAQDDGHNELGYRIADEEAEYDERGEQGPERDEPPRP